MQLRRPKGKIMANQTKQLNAIKFLVGACVLYFAVMHLPWVLGLVGLYFVSAMGARILNQ